MLNHGATRFTLLLAALTLAAPLLAANRSSGPAPAPRASRPTTPEPLTLVGYVAPTRGTGDAIRLAGGWSPSRGWVQLPDGAYPEDWSTPPPSRFPAAWQATAWHLLPGLSGRGRIITTKPVPEWSEYGSFYNLTAPVPGGVALSGTARPIPRRARQQNPMRAELRESTRRLLIRNGLPAPARPRILDSCRVDLNGDGVEEVLWTARAREGWHTPYADRPDGPKPGDYALLGIRYLTKNGVRSAALSLASAGHDADRYRLMAPVDIDGDGRLEIVAHRQGFEEDDLLLFTFDGQRIARVLAP